jgi:group II intron reverse transcriptase/maturase
VRKYLNYGYKQVVETDIEDCFGTIPHQELLDMVAERIVDGKVLRLIKLFLQAGVMEEKVAKKGDEGTPQGGVISPLLANIYLNQIDKGWKSVSRAARLIRYADDLVIMTRCKAEGYKIGLERMVNRIKLRLKERKTRTVDMDKGSFDFLGYTFMRVKNELKKKEITLCFPSAKATNNIRKKVRQITNYRRPIEVGQVVEELTPVIRGWVNYYRLGNSSKKFGKLKQYTAQKVRKFMNRRRQKSGYGWKRYSDKYLYGALGLYNDYRLSWTKAL